jgi:uncharacterized protein
MKSSRGGNTMRVLISPAKTFAETDEPCLSVPAFIDDATHLASLVRKLDDRTLMEGMRLSPSLLEKTRASFNTFGKTRSPALMTYDGVAFKAFRKDPLTHQTRVKAQDKLVILSGLYGALRPFDCISPYRLEMKDRTVMDLDSYWKPKISDYLMDTTGDGVIFNACSAEYSHVTKGIPGLVTLRFVDRKTGRALPSVFQKTMRGLFARRIVDLESDDPEVVKDIRIDGFAYDPDRSDASTWVFSGRTP